MFIRMLMSCVIGSAALCGAASAQEAGSTTGPAAGTNVAPSPAIQKQSEGRSVGESPDYRGSSSAAGAPGIEGKPGVESGPAPDRTAKPIPNR
ncbi:hypothetical protein [Methylocapsa acidiphila]|uniref:hypothetical protein n=1 Tax=Methylocapsa acidiphila TaxID=133552 RepID=UPI0003FC09A5|nr:hypothetical protein [Methylocapsa acidiphila]